jgi:hypothetical protein
MDVADKRARLTIHDGHGNVPHPDNRYSPATLTGIGPWCVNLLRGTRCRGDRGKRKNADQIRFHLFISSV